jgi:hypothetical protein
MPVSNSTDISTLVTYTIVTAYPFLSSSTFLSKPFYLSIPRYSSHPSFFPLPSLPPSYLDWIFFYFNNIIFILKVSKPLFQTTMCCSRVNERIDTDSGSKCWPPTPHPMYTAYSAGDGKVSYEW